MKILITGGSGYFGRLIIDSLIKREDIDLIINVDKNFMSHDSPKYIFLQPENWQNEVNKFGKIDIILNLAYKIRRPYKQKHLEIWVYENILISEETANFALKNKIKKFIHFSTIALYGAKPTNSLAKKFTEESEVHLTGYDYADNKLEIERRLISLWKQNKNSKTKLIILRVASVTGPIGQSLKSKRGLITFLKSKLPFLIYVNDESGRQYLHENDLVNAVQFLIDLKIRRQIEIFNLAPKDFLTFKQMAKLQNKIAIKIPYLLAKLLFNFAWKISRGKIPTPPGAIDSFAYPIFVDGSKIEKYGFKYKYSSKDAFLAKQK